MSVYRVNKNLSRQEQINLLNEMILEVNGMVTSGKFDKTELDTLYSYLATIIGIDRKFLRNQLIGNTLGTYSGWSHVYDYSSYGIWKFSPVNYKYNASNELYFDSKSVENVGEATSEEGSGNSVISLLALSMDEIVSESWKWCTYNNYIYVTIRNNGEDSYEGDYFLRSSSSDTNKQNFFIYNHSFSSDYEDTTYVENGFIIENRTSDPSTPQTGRMWIRTDL